MIKFAGSGYVCEVDVCHNEDAWEVTDDAFQHGHNVEYICLECFAELSGEWVATCNSGDGSTLRAKFVDDLVSLHFFASREAEKSRHKVIRHKQEIHDAVCKVLVDNEATTLDRFRISPRDGSVRFYLDGHTPSVYVPPAMAKLLLKRIAV